MDLESADTVPLRNVPDVFGMIGHRYSATESRILQGRDARSIRVLIPDSRGLDQNFHDVTVVDMGDLPESHVSITELSDLANKWPPVVINHMRWRQPELEEMRRAARVQQPAPCDFYGMLIRCDMFWHVARCHVDLAQLWRCPVSWCTVWKGTPQDLMDHVRNAHNVLERVQDIRMERLFPPWTVTRQVYTESLTLRHSGISNDVLLFSDIGLSLVHHYRVHKRGLPHERFTGTTCRNYVLCCPSLRLCQSRGGSPDPACSTVIESPDVMCASPRPFRCAFARQRPTRVMETPVRIAPRLTVQEPLAAGGAVVLDCHPQVLTGVAAEAGKWGNVGKSG